MIFDKSAIVFEPCIFDLIVMRRRVSLSFSLFLLNMPYTVVNLKQLDEKRQNNDTITFPSLLVFGRCVTSKYIHILYDKQGVIGTMDTTTTIFEIVHINVYM